MTKQQIQDLALIRYAAIAPLINGTAKAKSVSDFCEQAATQEFLLPDGRRKKFSAKTIQGWYYRYSKRGFESLQTNSRKDLGSTRTLDDDLQEQIRYLKLKYPRMPSTEIRRRLLESGAITEDQVSLSTITRFVNRFAAESKMTNNQDMHRYERPHINEVWNGDSSYGPKFTENGKKRRIYCIALVDDASRFIVGAELFYNDNYENLLKVMKSAVSRYGKPQIWNFDNGSNYRNQQIELLAARIGTAINYNFPNTPVQKAKIERWFRTLKDQWMAGLDLREFSSLDQLNDSLASFVNTYNKRPHSSLGDMSPEDRFFSEPERIRRLSPEEIEKAFLLEITRRVSADNVISIDSVEYEVPNRFSRKRITLRYTPDMSEIYVLEADDTLTPVRLLNKTENALMKRERIRYSAGED